MEAIRALDMFSALSQATRLDVFRLLVTRGSDGMAAGEIAHRVGTPSNTMSTHLAILERAGLVTSRRTGRSIIYAADLSGARDLLLYLVEDCCGGRPEVCAPVREVIDAACACPSSPPPQWRPRTHRWLPTTPPPAVPTTCSSCAPEIRRARSSPKRF